MTPEELLEVKESLEYAFKFSKLRAADVEMMNKVERTLWYVNRDYKLQTTNYVKGTPQEGKT